MKSSRSSNQHASSRSILVRACHTNYLRHFRGKIFGLLLFLTVCSFTGPTLLAQVIFVDSMFAPADWDVFVFAQPHPPSGGVASQGLGPALRLHFQKIDHTLGGGTPASDVLSIHINRNATYQTKTLCPIAFLSYSEQSRTLVTEPGTFGAGTGPALRQGGNYYVASFAPTRNDVNGVLPSPYITNSFSGLTANDFNLVLGPGRYDTSAHPDFSRAGSLIEFGFARVSSHAASSLVTRSTAIDDWGVSITVVGPTVADYGDAPDGSLGMETGYYGFVPVAANVFVLASQSGPAFFPTVQSNAGPFTASGDLFIAPLAPSLESDANGPVDPDVTVNLPFPFADGDAADGGASMLLIFAVSARPPALFFTVAASAPTGPAAGFWNAAFDLDQDGDWGPGEWVAQNIPFSITPGGVALLASPLFRWGPPGAQFGRLNFPVWARNMVTSEMIDANTPLAGPPGMQYYAGAGPACGFTFGEVEDYFVEWIPVGQMTNEPPEEVSRPVGFRVKLQALPATYGPDLPNEHLVQFQGPATIPIGQRVEYALSGPPVEKLALTYLPNGAAGGAVGPHIDLSTNSPAATLDTPDVVAELEWVIDMRKLYVTTRRAPETATLVVHGVPADAGVPGPGVPSGGKQTPVFGATMIRIQDIIRITNIRAEEGQLRIEWAGGKAPYKIQKSANLNAAWADLSITDGKTGTVPIVGPSGYFRVIGGSQ